MHSLKKLFMEMFVVFPLHFILLLFLVFLQTFSNTLSVLAIAPLTDYLLNVESQGQSNITIFSRTLFQNLNIEYNLISICCFLGSTILASAFLGVASLNAILRIKYDVLLYLIDDTLNKFFKANYLFFNNGDVGKFINTIQQEINKVADAFGNIAQTLANIIQILIFITVPYFLSPELTINFIIICSILTLPFFMFNKITNNLGDKNVNTANKMLSILHENLISAKLILSFGNQKFSHNRYTDAYKKHANVSILFQTLQRGLPLFVVPIGMISILVCIYIASIRSIPFSEISMFMFALTRVVPLIGLIVGAKTTIQGFLPAFRQLNELKNDAKALEQKSGALLFQKIKNQIELHNISFSFPGRLKTLKNINLKLNKGNVIAFLGESGSGKTTLVDIILGLYEPDEGHILIDNDRFEKYDIGSFRNKIAYVAQDPQLFNCSIRENLLWSNPDATEEDIWAACSLADSSDFIKELPKKLETKIGNSGGNLSGGQRQRLSLARAILRKPELLILDEPTSALDSKSENFIKNAIKELSSKTTILIITHRISIVNQADYIYLVKDGSIIEEGSYQKLSNEENSELSKMINIQNP